MIPRTPVLYVRHSALDSVDPDDIDGLREVWSSFSGAKNSINQGTRLEYLSWRLYTRGILQKHRKKQENLEVPPLVDPPALEMSSSTESIAKGSSSSNRLISLFDRICTNPATPEETLKPRAPPIRTDDLMCPDPAPVQVTPVTTPTMEVVPPSPREGIAMERAPEPVVCGFDRVSVNSRSSVSLNQQAGASATPLSADIAGASVTAPVTSSRGMFFIESSSDSEPEPDHEHEIDHNDDHNDDDIPVPVPTRPGLVRRKTVTFEEPKSLTHTTEEEKDKPDDDNQNSDDYEDISDGSDWGDSEWDDLSEDEEPMFSGRDVPRQPQERRSLLSSMFAGASVQRVATPEHQEMYIPSPDSVPRTNTSEVGSVPYLGRVESQSSLFESAMRSKGTDVEQIILNNNLQSHVPIPDRSGTSFSSNVSDEIMERELSQSIRSNLSHKRLYDLDVLWGRQRVPTPKPERQRRPTLARSTTMPAPPNRAQDDEDIQDSHSYHTRGW